MPKAVRSTTTRAPAPLPAGGLFPPAQKTVGGGRPQRAARVSPAQVERLVGARERIAAAVERLIAILDEDEPDAADLEDNGDAEGPDVDREPELGAPESDGRRQNVDQSRAWAQPTGGEWDDGREHDTADDEPSLGSVGANYERYSQEGWAAGVGDGREDEHDGAEPDDDGEPSFGSTHAVSQLAAWHESHVGSWWGSGEGEPSLGWTSAETVSGRYACMNDAEGDEHDGCEPEEDKGVCDDPHDDRLIDGETAAAAEPAAMV